MLSSYNLKDNIVAVVTAYGYSGVGIVRVSGKESIQELAQKISHIDRIKPRFAYYENFYDADDEIIDSGIMIYFQNPHSFTGEDVLEFQTHGNPLILQMIINRLLGCGCRLALAGEFTFRAFMNNKIDLLQAESIADLITAKSTLAVKNATLSLQGEFSKKILQLDKQLIDLRVFIEASLDFPEEEIPYDVTYISNQLVNIKQDLQNLIFKAKSGLQIMNGINIIILGKPNMGKSSLMNAISLEEVAIVTDIAGTTRDLIKNKIEYKGISLNFIDTAGIRNNPDKIEAIGIDLAKKSLATTQVCLLLIDPLSGLEKIDLDILKDLPSEIKIILVVNKIDLVDNYQKNILYNNDYEVVSVSALKKIGINELLQKILQVMHYHDADNHENSIFSARERHIDLLQKTKTYIDTINDIDLKHLELIAQELLYAHNNLRNILAKELQSDDLLGEIFSNFCIGK